MDKENYMGRFHDDDRWGWWEERSLAEKIALGILFTIAGLAILAGALFLFGLIVMKLWNWLMPDIFGLGTISYWQAWGLLVLSSILFKKFGSHDSGDNWRTERKRKRALRSVLHKAESGCCGSSAFEGSEPTAEGESVPKD